MSGVSNADGSNKVDFDVGTGSTPKPLLPSVTIDILDDDEPVEYAFRCGDVQFSILNLVFALIFDFDLFLRLGIRAPPILVAPQAFSIDINSTTCGAETQINEFRGGSKK